MESEPQHPNPLALELLEMARIDQAMRTQAQQDPAAWDSSVDQRNTVRLKEMVEEMGWPTISKVGAEASHAAWTLVQHACAEPDFMKRCLELMKRAAANDDVLPAHIAFLEDRLLTLEGQPQLYGTQFRNLGEGWEPFPIEDPDRVDERRASVGLGTLAEDQAQISALYSS